MAAKEDNEGERTTRVSESKAQEPLGCEFSDKVLFVAPSLMDKARERVKAMFGRLNRPRRPSRLKALRSQPSERLVF